MVDVGFKVTRVPALKCPQCSSFRVTTNGKGSVICLELGCKFKTTKAGNKKKEDDVEPIEETPQEIISRRQDELEGLKNLFPEAEAEIDEEIDTVEGYRNLYPDE